MLGIMAVIQSWSLMKINDHLLIIIGIEKVASQKNVFPTWSREDHLFSSEIIKDHNKITAMIPNTTFHELISHENLREISFFMGSYSLCDYFHNFKNRVVPLPRHATIFFSLFRLSRHLKKWRESGIFKQEILINVT